MVTGKEVADFEKAYALWQLKGSPEMISVVSGKGPFSRKLSLRGNFRLFYLYNPKYVEFSWDIHCNL